MSSMQHKRGGNFENQVLQQKIGLKEERIEILKIEIGEKKNKHSWNKRERKQCLWR